MMSRKLLAVAVMLVVAMPTHRGNTAEETTYEAVVSGMTCKQNRSGSLECAYHVGRSLYFTIAGIGERDAGITFMSSNFDGDFYASIGVLHGCVIVKPGKLKPNMIDFAFVSPRDGKVYRDWEACGASKK